MRPSYQLIAALKSCPVLRVHKETHKVKPMEPLRKKRAKKHGPSKGVFRKRTASLRGMTLPQPCVKINLDLYDIPPEKKGVVMIKKYPVSAVVIEDTVVLDFPVPQYTAKTAHSHAGEVFEWILMNPAITVPELSLKTDLREPHIRNLLQRLKKSGAIRKRMIWEANPVVKDFYELPE